MDKAKTKLDTYIKKESIPNILFFGPYMCGKEEIYNQFIKNLYKTSENICKYVLTINCLSTNGIKIIKEHIKLFSMQIIPGLLFDFVFAFILINFKQASVASVPDESKKAFSFLLLCWL